MMTSRIARLATVASVFAVMVVAQSEGAGVSVSELHKSTHIHGIAVDRIDASRLLIATHHGLFRAGPEGIAELVSEVQDFMGFNAHPSDPAMLYASGHPAGGGNLGFIASTDQGVTWRQISPGANGPVDFHQMSVSAADPKTFYGAYGDIQISRDSGRTWSVVAPAPEKLIDLAASSVSADTVFAATEAGLSVSHDAGKTFEVVLNGAPVSLVEAAPGGILYAFVVGKGLVWGDEASLTFSPLSQDFGDEILLHLAVDPKNQNRLFAATAKGKILLSADGGRNWTTIGSNS